MDPVSLGVVGIFVLVFLFLLGMPIAFSMAIVGFVGFALVTDLNAAFTILPRDFF